MPLDYESFSALSEVRLHPAAACRAWTQAKGCWSAQEWNEVLNGLPFWRSFFEIARLRISEVLAVEGIDPLGIMRKLLIHESTAALSRNWLRETGFVHLEAASGIHLYCLWNAFESFLQRITQQRAERLKGIRILRTAIPVILWVGFWGLSGFRPGLLRPLVLVLFRWAGNRLGFRWRTGVPILIALGFDAGVGFFTVFGTSRTFSEWAPGEVHYALSWWGGIFGYEWAKTKNYGSLRAHFTLSMFSWLAILPLDLAEGHFAYWTPVLSLITVEFFVRGGFLAFTSVAAGVALTRLDPQFLQWMSVLWNSGIARIAEGVSRVGGIRDLHSSAGALFAGFLGLGLLGFLFFRFRSTEHPAAYSD